MRGKDPTKMNLMMRKTLMRKTLKTSVRSGCHVIGIKDLHFVVTTVDRYSHSDDYEEPIQPRSLAFEDADNEREENEALAKHFQTKSASHSIPKALDTMELQWALDKKSEAFARRTIDAQVFIVRVQVFAIYYSF
jgi:hypothetical protein